MTTQQAGAGRAPGAPADCEVRVLEPGRVLALLGRLDVHSAADVRLACAAAVSAGAGELVLDLSAVQTVDPTGLGVLVGAHRRAGRAGRTLVLRDVPPPVRRLLVRTRLDRVLQQSRTAARCA